MKMDRIVQVFPADEELRPEWRDSFESAGYSLMPFDEKHLHETVCMLLFTPVRSEDNEWISPERVWKNYCASQFPEIKIIQMGYHRVSGVANYWHYSAAPINIDQCIQEAVPATAWKPVDTLGQDLRGLWAKFRDGHDKGGFMDWFIVAKRRIKSAVDKIGFGIQKGDVLNDLFSDPNTIESFSNTIARWGRYYLCFNAAPCSADLTAIDECIAKIAQFERLKDSPDLLEDLTALAADFTKVDSLLKKITPWFTYDRAT